MSRPIPIPKNNKFKSDLCSDEMTFNECELAILRNAADENEKQQSKKIANSEDVGQMIGILEDFIRNKKCICYGGTAINNILPKHAQFYNRDIEIPDYDFYTPNALEYAKELADIYYKAGFKEVEAKAGIHYGTFKVFVNFIPIADITHLNPTIFKSLTKDAINIDHILYAPPNFLRMSMYLELSRPAGDVSRWEKVFKRLSLLNQYLPLKVETCTNKTEFKQRTDVYDITRDTLVEEGVVFFGGYATGFYSEYISNETNGVRITDFDVLSEEPDKCAKKLVKKLEASEFNNVNIKKHIAVGEIIPECVEVRIGQESVAFIYKPVACHNYNTINIQKREIKIATIDTMLSFYLAFYYSDNLYFVKERILCMAKLLFDVEEKTRLEQKGVLKRFNMQCIGQQPTLESMRSEKMEKYNELKHSRDTKDYDMWFLRYNPKSILKSLNKTRKMAKSKYSLNTYSSKKDESSSSKKDESSSSKKESEYLF